MAKLRNAMFADAVMCAFQKLPPRQKEIIDEIVCKIVRDIENMGTRSALELLAKYGIFKNHEIDELVILLDIIDREEEKLIIERVNLEWKLEPLELSN